ncbi:MAG: hypothetical protein AAB656_00060 [Patescibacteria group bacterium]|mgnify:CR=1 FL=1
MHVKQLICGLPKKLRRPLLKIVSNLEVVVWNIRNRPSPPPHYVKVKIISDYAKRFRTETLIETGTYLGQTVDDLKSTFDMIYSVELDKILYRNAKRIFSRRKNIKIIQGNSSIILPRIIKHIKECSLFWLDAHYSGGITTRGSKETPILDELQAVARSKVKGHVILIDDAREFTGKGNYPTIKKIRTFVNEKFPNYKIKISDDIIQIYPHEIKILER